MLKYELPKLRRVRFCSRAVSCSISFSMPASESDKDLVRRIRQGEEVAWRECISLYEGRLQAFVSSRLGNPATAEDVVQDTFLGFLTSLPNFDEETPVEAFLFAIAAHKLTDVLRKNGRRPTLPLMADDSADPTREPVGKARMASSLARSYERHGIEEKIICTCLSELIERWHAKGEFERLKCAELLFALDLPNKDVADMLNLTEQTVANHKYFIVNKLKEAVKIAKLPSFDLSEFGISD